MGLGAGAVLIGLIEGIADASASIFKPLSGAVSDKTNNRKSLIFGGYTLSTISKPLLALSSGWGFVLILRFVDRLGKALRNPPRDAIISLSSKEDQTGYNFGLQRAFDRIGSVGGPFLALLVLYFFPDNIRAVFLFAVIPAILAVFLIRYLKEVKVDTEKILSPKKTTNKSIFYVFIISNVIFSLGNSSNVFILLKADEIGFSILMIPLAWALYNLSCALSSPILGKLSDKTGRPFVIMLSFVYYAILYYLFAMAKTELSLWILFAAYGVHYGLSKGVFKAFIADICSEKEIGRAYGIFDMWTGISLFFASLIMGIIWEQLGSSTGFMLGAIFSLVALLVFWLGMKFQKQGKSTGKSI
jgi:MFS family permease